MSFSIPIGDRQFRPSGAMLLIAGPCVIESRDHCLKMAEILEELIRPVKKKVLLVFKSSFDKANRSSISSQRGPGLDGGLKILEEVKKTFDLPVLTDIHLPDQAKDVAEVVDILQIPAFLCRQTDLLMAAAETMKPLNIKKGQFLAPWDMKHPIIKVKQAGNPNVMICERGSTFGYNNLVVDFCGFPTMRNLGAPLIFDATHSVQLPGGLGNHTGGRRDMAPVLARAAAAAGVDGFFMEVHDDPDHALSDGPNQLTIPLFKQTLEQILAIRKAWDAH
jgi:2-dehydro-3-deoxyphosphooctonate aldolase (KDO 8-P synthase)